MKEEKIMTAQSRTPEKDSLHFRNESSGSMFGCGFYCVYTDKDGKT